jgi:hypothetical protein
MNELPPSADIGPGGQSVGQAAQFCLGRGLIPRPRKRRPHFGTPVCTKNSNPDVMMVKSAKDGVRFDASNSLNLASDRRILIQ